MEKGYAFEESYMPDLTTESLAKALGRTLSPRESRTVQELVPRAHGAPNTYSGLYGLSSFPFHTDLAHWSRPPRYLLLRCQRGSSDVPTYLADSHSLIEAIGHDVIARAIFRPRRPRSGTLALLRLWERTDEGGLFRWDETFITPASPIGGRAALEVRQWLTQCAPVQIALERTGDMLIIDNWRMLHARSPVPEGLTNRKIERVYLEELH